MKLQSLSREKAVPRLNIQDFISTKRKSKIMSRCEDMLLFTSALDLLIMQVVMVAWKPVQLDHLRLVRRTLSPGKRSLPIGTASISPALYEFFGPFKVLMSYSYTHTGCLTN